MIFYIYFGVFEERTQDLNFITYPVNVDVLDIIQRKREQHKCKKCGVKLSHAQLLELRKHVKNTVSIMLAELHSVHHPIGE